MTELGQLTAEGDRRAIRLERHYRASVEELWSTLTDPERVARWLLCEATFEPMVGGAVRFRWEGEGGGEMNGTIVVFEPGKTIEYTWSEGDATSVVRFELQPDDDGVTLLLHHRELPSRAAAGTAAGWHTHLEALGALLAGEPFEFWPRFRELEPAYTELASAL